MDHESSCDKVIYEEGQLQRRSNRPEQLRLELQWQYLNWLSETGEEQEFYEKASLALLGDGKRIVPKDPLWPKTKQILN